MKPLKDWDNFKDGFTFGQIYPSGWGPLSGHKHLGLDKICPNGTQLFMPFNGWVSRHDGPEGGICVWVKPDDQDVVIRFMHLSDKSAISEGHFLEGNTIALTNNTGASTGGHLHLDISKGSVQINNFSNFIDPETFNWEGEPMGFSDDQMKGTVRETLRHARQSLFGHVDTKGLEADVDDIFPHIQDGELDPVGKKIDAYKASQEFKDRWTLTADLSPCPIPPECICPEPTEKKVEVCQGKPATFWEKLKFLFS